MPPQYRPPPNANTIYVYKDGPLIPDPELSGEEQLAQQTAYIASFARFDEDDHLAANEEEDQEDESMSDDDIFDEDGQMKGATELEIDYVDAPTEEAPNEILAELLREEKRTVAWLAISDDLDGVLSAKYTAHFIAASQLDIGSQIKEEKEIDPNNHKGDVPSLTKFDFPRYWNHTMGILSKKDSTPQPGLYPLQDDWKIVYTDQSARHHDHRHDAERKTQCFIDLPRMFELHNNGLRTILRKWDLLPFEDLRDEDGNLLVIEPTAEDAQNLAEILLMDSMAGGWVATSSLLSRIQEVYMVCGPPPQRESPVQGQPDLLVVEDDLNALVKLYHYYHDQAAPKLQAMRLLSNRMPGKNEIKEIADLVERVIQSRNAVRVAKGKAVGIEVKPKTNRSTKKGKVVPRDHPIHPMLHDPYATMIGIAPRPPNWSESSWKNHSMIGQSLPTDWTSPDAGERYSTASYQRAQGQLHNSKHTANGELLPQDAFEDWCQSMQSKEPEELD